MRDLPIIFPISLAVLIIALFFMGAYAVSAGAVEERQAYGIERQVSDDSLFQKGALFVCPFH